MIVTTLALTMGLWLGHFPAVTSAPDKVLELKTSPTSPPSQESSWQKTQRAKAKAEFPGRKRKVLIEAGHRHLKLGVWCRNKGLNSQATMEFLRAVEVAEHQHPGAKKVLDIMQGYGDAFWQKRRKSFPKGLLSNYEKRLEKVLQKNAKERLGLAKWATEFGLKEGEHEFRALVALKDAPLEFDKKERIKIAGGTVPKELSKVIREEAVKINERLWLRDEFLALLPDVEAIQEVETKRIRVRTTGSTGQAQQVLDACTALLPVLAKDTGAQPTERLQVFLFSKEGEYAAYLTASGMTQFQNAKGFAMSSSRTAYLNTFAISDGDVRALALHEVTHLFVFGFTRTRMPDWYNEGFAETYGGQGCHTLDEATFEFHQVMVPHRLARLRSGEGLIPLKDLLTAKALTRRANPEQGLDFYAQSWAFLRFLRIGAGGDARKKLELWEAICRGKALGAVLDKPTESADVLPAQALFAELFDSDLVELEADFLIFLKAL
ncbi:MAG: hypothetical protein GY930_08360 [bacterium]|nr:hypothetical protein [bacterium]